MPDGRIRVGSAPSKNRRTIDDEITCANRAATDGDKHGQHEETFIHGSSSCMTALALLGGTGNAEPSLPVRWQPTCQGEGGLRA
jgi:hypothetical protein